MWTRKENLYFNVDDERVNRYETLICLLSYALHACNIVSFLILKFVLQYAYIILIFAEMLLSTMVLMILVALAFVSD